MLWSTSVSWDPSGRGSSRIRGSDPDVRIPGTIPPGASQRT